MTGPKEAARKTIVKGVSVSHLKPGDPFYPGAHMIGEEYSGEIWWVRVTTQEGLLPEASHSTYCKSLAEVERIKGTYIVGKEMSGEHENKWPGLESKRRKFLLAAMDGGYTPAGGNAGDEDSPLAFNTLEAAGITDGLKLTKAVLASVGKQRVGELKAKHGENWEAAVTYEYCLLNLPHSSPAFIAAAYQFNWYITGDEFKAGYLWRDLECITSGIELEALKAIEMRQKAGKKGSQSSAKARNRRILSLLIGMEATARRNPDIIKLGITPLAELGLVGAIEADPKLWSQGRGQMEEYLGEMKRGEAGKDIQARYLALLPAKTA
ncbi:hypothetical protein VWZ88_08680 [Phaeobacter sp. JH20_36]|uniref:hypothetical protein n=1 Tax=unclassified Phaeobacter TaxID=2621772 RepID=UPI003A8516A1